MCLRLAVIPRTLLFILILYSFDKTDESFLTLKAHLSVKTCVMCSFNNMQETLLYIQN